MRLLTNIITEIGPEVGCCDGFCHHRWQPRVRICTHIAIFCVKVERKQVCEQSLYAKKIYHYYINTKNNLQDVLVAIAI